MFAGCKTDCAASCSCFFLPAECAKGANLIHACVGIAMSLLFTLISLVLSVADGSDLNPHSKALYASPCGNWTFRRAFIKTALPLLAAALPNYIHLRVNVLGQFSGVTELSMFTCISLLNCHLWFVPVLCCSACCFMLCRPGCTLSSWSTTIGCKSDMCHITTPGSTFCLPSRPAHMPGGLSSS